MKFEVAWGSKFRLFRCNVKRVVLLLEPENLTEQLTPIITCALDKPVSISFVNEMT